MTGDPPPNPSSGESTTSFHPSPADNDEGMEASAEGGEHELPTAPPFQDMLQIRTTDSAMNESATKERNKDAIVDRIGKYRVVEQLGHGGQGDVYRVVNPALPGRDLVVKWARYALSPEQQQQLLAEGQVLARLDDPGLVRVYDVDVHEGRPFVVMEYVPGRSLRHELKQGLPAPRRAAALVADLAETLARVHQQGVLHRDLKPANVLLDGTGRPRLADFGLALSAAAWGEANGPGREVSGTLQYMAPEQAAGQGARIGPRTDVFGLGSVLYELLTGRPPYQGTDVMELLEKARAAQVVPPRQVNARVPRALERICLKAMAAEPEQRYASATEMERDLRRAARRFPPARRVVPAGVAAVLLLAFALAVWLWPRSAEPFKGSIDVVVTEAGNPRRQLLQLYEPAARPLKVGDEVRVEATLNRPAYLYVLWIDTRGQVGPVYPWLEGDWDRRGPEEPVRELSLPKEVGHVWTITSSPPGMETLVLLVREKPLPPEEDLRERLGDLGPQTWTDPQALAWFENGQMLRGDALRAPNLKETRTGNNPAVRVNQVLWERLRDLFPYQRAVSFGNRGG